MSKFVPKITFRTGVAARRDVICVSGAVDEFDPSEPYSRVLVYAERNPQLWRFWEADYIVTSICLWKEPSRDKLLLVSLSEEGDVVIMEDPLIHGKIKEAGLHHGDAKGWGYMSDIQQIGDHLYACGFSGQVYRREGSNNWVHMDTGILQPPQQQGGEYSAQAINGRDEKAIYLAGCEHFPGYPVRADFWNGHVWNRLTLPPEAGRITNIYVESEKRIWMCGANGTLLLGNAHDGFAILKSAKGKQLFLSLCKFQEKIYLGSNIGLFRYDPANPVGGIRKVWTRMKPELQDANVVESVDDVLWSIGPKDIARFDGVKWERIHHPDNPPASRKF